MRLSPKFLVIAAVPAFLIAFQNCSKHDFNTVDATVASQAAGDPTLTPVSPIPYDPNIPVVCDPFSGGQCGAESGTGLAGQIYSYRNGVGVQNYIEKGTLIPALVVLNEVNVPVRAFDDGFPTTSGTVLKDEIGDRLVEFFALDLRGSIKMNNAFAPGQYQFALFSDDGAILTVDGKEVVNNDGTHPASWKCASTSVDLKSGVAHAVRLRYYQGPANHIAIRLLWRPWSKKDLGCNENGSWDVVPASVLSH